MRLANHLSITAFVMSFLTNAIAQPVPVEQIVAVVRDLCQSPNGSGKVTELKVGASGDAKVKFKLADGKLGGEVAFSRTEWEGVRKVLTEQQAAENANYRECVKTLTPTFMEKLAPKQTGKTIGQVYFQSEPFQRSVEPTGDAEMDSIIRQTRARASGPLSFPSYPFIMSFMGLIGEPEFDELKLSYTSKEESGRLIVEPHLPYLENVLSGKEVVGFGYFYDPFVWGFPNFSIKTVNNSDQSVFLSRVTVRVKTVRIITTPIPIFAENWNRVGRLVVENHGYGQFLSPRIKAKVLAENEAADAKLDSLTIDWAPSQKDSAIDVDVQSAIPDELKKAPVVAVVGLFFYRDSDGKDYQVPFRTRVSLREPPPAAPMPPSAQYEILLDADKQNYEVSTNVSQVLKPREFDNFLLRIASTKYAQYDAEIIVTGLSGEIVARRRLILTVFKPKSGSPVKRKT